MKATTPTFSALRSGLIVLHLITEENVDAVRKRFGDYADASYMIGELNKSCIPRYDERGRRTKWGFYSMLGDELAGLSLLGISSWENLRGYTGADTLAHMRGRGVAPGSKPHVFYLGFALLGLNGIETGCSPSNVDELRFAILRRDWERLYDASRVELIA